MKTIEKRLAALEARYLTLYNRTYARYTRRVAADRRVLARAYEYAELYKKATDLTRRLGWIVRNFKAGKVIPYLTKRECDTLKYILKRKRPFKKRVRK